MDEVRFDDIHTIDLRAEKELTFGDVGATIGLDVFNVTNESTVLQRRLQLGLTSSDYITEHLSPRIVRVGVRLNLR